jgi:hypothetical protein
VVSVTGTVEGAAGVTGASRRASVTGAGRGVTSGVAAESGWA